MRIRAAIAILLLSTAPLAAEDQPKPPTDKPLSAPAGDPAKEKEAEKPKWDVANPPYPFDVDVSLDVDTGTWMSLDVSPDGKEIVVRPARRPLRDADRGRAGARADLRDPVGHAAAVLAGRQVDRLHLRPLGRRQHLDRRPRRQEPAAGHEGDPSAFPNSPAWTPDSQYIAARKHFTGTRSLGAGEIWLWHRSGGEGLQMTKRATEQKDDGEPAFSPDGRYLYWSEDSTPGKIFEYNKDPNDADLRHQAPRPADGQDRSATSPGPGGSIRPTPSPDGKSLAFIRRVRYKSTLFVKDIESGVERPVWDGLERDMQETWAIQGVYPGMAWTPDSKSVVFWSGGKIRSADLAGKQVAEIPFRVKDTRKAASAVRFGVDVLTGLMQASASPYVHKRTPSGDFPVRMLRWVSVSPDGKRVAYQALGYVYVRDLPERLTQAPDHPDRSLRALPVLVARLEVPRLHDLERRVCSARSASPPSPRGPPAS